ncbi:MAG: hypothetical protein IPH28_16555 [Cytophagaceae bacterium]|nr:hypothetical protein [Cytophagaceae bacterium]
MINKILKTVAVILLTGFSVWGISSYYQNQIEQFDLFLIIFVPVLLFHYLLFRKLFNRKIRPYVLLALVFLYLSDLIYISRISINYETKMNSQMVLMLITQFLYLIEFRSEDSRLAQIKGLDILKVVIPAVVIFFLSGFVFLDVENIFQYFLMFLTAILIFLLTIISMYRPVNNYSFYVLIAGVMLMFFSNILYVFFYFKSPIDYIFSSSITCYFVSQILIIEGFTSSYKVLK